VGECSCVSVHGANRLGTNSLLDLLVFGRAAGNHIVVVKRRHKPLPADAADARWPAWPARTRAANTPRTSPTTSAHHAEARWRVPHAEHGRRRREDRRPRRRHIHLKDKSKVFNTARVEALEVDNLIEVAKATMVSAEARKESRGAHATHSERTRRRKLAQAHAVVQRRQPPDYKPVNLKPLTVEPRSGEEQSRNRSVFFKIYRYDPDKDARPTCRPTVELKVTSACCWTRWSSSRPRTTRSPSAAPAAKACAAPTR
jgi:succinate dehydrogenase / fumarate reductase flavoprotein subunit